MKFKDLRKVMGSTFYVHLVNGDNMYHDEIRNIPYDFDDKEVSKIIGANKKPNCLLICLK